MTKKKDYKNTEKCHFTFQIILLLFLQHYAKMSLKYSTGPGCSKLTMSLVNVSLKFQMLISLIHQYFLLKKCEKLLLLTFFQQKISVYLVIKP